ncbi:hypothetical protein Tco_1505073 [Tanacetum coccineum]
MAGWDGTRILRTMPRNLQAGGEYEDNDEDIRRSPYKDKDTEDINKNRKERIFKKKAKSKQNQARDGKVQVKSKSKVIHMKKIQLEGLKLPNPKLYYKNQKTRVEIAKGAKFCKEVIKT